MIIYNLCYQFRNSHWYLEPVQKSATLLCNTKHDGTGKRLGCIINHINVTNRMLYCCKFLMFCTRIAEVVATGHDASINHSVLRVMVLERWTRATLLQLQGRGGGHTRHGRLLFSYCWQQRLLINCIKENSGHLMPRPQTEMFFLAASHSKWLLLWLFNWKLEVSQTIR